MSFVKEDFCCNFIKHETSFEDSSLAQAKIHK